MTNATPIPSGEDDGRAVSARERPPGIPRWLKLSLIVVALLVALAIGISLVAGVRHGPGQFGPGQHGPAPASSRSVQSA